MQYLLNMYLASTRETNYSATVLIITMASTIQHHRDQVLCELTEIIKLC